VPRPADAAVDGAAVLLGEISDGRIDSEQAWFWTREWQAKEREADDDLTAGRGTRYESDDEPGGIVLIDQASLHQFVMPSSARRRPTSGVG
jgi:hypothetical protein